MLYLLATFLSCFLAFLLFNKGQKSPADKILVAWLIVLGIHLFLYYLLYTGHESQYPGLLALGIPLPLAHGPFLYLYATLQTSSAPFRKRLLLHFLPVLLSYLLFARFFFMPFEQKIAVFEQKGQGFETEVLVNLLFIYASGIVYTSLSFVRLLKYRKSLVHRFSNTEKINFNWLLYLIVWIVLIWLVIFISGKDKFIFAAASFFILWIGYFGIRQVRVFTQPGSTLPPSSATIAAAPEEISQHTEGMVESEPGRTEVSAAAKYLRSPLKDPEAEVIHERLKQFISEQKPYLNPDLTLDELAKALAVHPNILSQVINSRENKNFYDLINAWRVEEFIGRLWLPESRQYTLLAIAFDCGFNSKASFNRNFKKHTGLSPRDFQKQHQEAEV